jgi:hypothetical protein
MGRIGEIRREVILEPLDEPGELDIPAEPVRITQPEPAMQPA